MSVLSMLPTPFKMFKTSQTIWFVSLMLAQLFFVIYLIAGYGISSVTTGLSQWNKFNTSAYVSGDTVGNTMYAGHVLLAIIMIVGGSLQLIPAIRHRFTRFHRYNGRVFVLLACTISLAGLYLITVRGTVGNTLMHSLTAFSGAVVIISSIFAVRAARKRSFALHQQWALRLFLAANSVLFFRLFIFAWFITFGSLGVNTENFTGPTVLSVSVLSYIVPLIIVQLVWYANKGKQPWLLISLSALLLLISAIFLLGLFGLIVGNWYPSVFVAS
jgi:uncharacterized membrane protein